MTIHPRTLQVGCTVHSKCLHHDSANFGSLIALQAGESRDKQMSCIVNLLNFYKRGEDGNGDRPVFIIME